MLPSFIIFKAITYVSKRSGSMMLFYWIIEVIYDWMVTQRPEFLIPNSGIKKGMERAVRDNSHFLNGSIIKLVTKLDLKYQVAHQTENGVKQVTKVSYGYTLLKG